MTLEIGVGSNLIGLIVSWILSFGKNNFGSWTTFFFFLGGIYEEKKNKNSAIENFQKYINNAPSGTYVGDAKERITYLKSLKQ